MNAILERCVFFKQSIMRFHTTGSVAPSSKHLCNSLVKPLEYLRQDNRPLRALEAGPGTGPITKLLLESLRPGDYFTAYEINSQLAEYLHKRLAPLAAERGITFEVRVEPVQNVAQTGEKHDLVISGLPFNNFEPQLVDEILAALLLATSDHGYFSFYEYIGIRNIKKVFLGSAMRQRIGELEKLLLNYRNRHEHSHNNVWLNLPPARAHTWRKQEALNALS